MNPMALHFLEGISNPMVVEAMVFGVNAHKGQIRKYTSEPYITHPIAVANKVAYHCKLNNEDPVVMVNMICASLLHDTLEDCEKVVNRDILEEKFGRVVKDYVYWLSAPSKGLSGGPQGHSRELRKKVDHAFLELAPPEVLVIKACDILHNGESIMLNDKGFGQVFFREVGDLFPKIRDNIKYESVQVEYEQFLNSNTLKKG